MNEPLMILGAICFLLGILVDTILCQRYNPISLSTEFKNEILECENERLKNEIELLQHKLIKQSFTALACKDTEKIFCSQKCKKQ